MLRSNPREERNMCSNLVLVRCGQCACNKMNCTNKMYGIYNRYYRSTTVTNWDTKQQQQLKVNASGSICATELKFETNDVNFILTEVSCISFKGKMHYAFPARVSRTQRVHSKVECINAAVNGRVKNSISFGSWNFIENSFVMACS